MGKYIKKFDTHSDYEDFLETEDFIRPNVSYCVDNVEVHYNPIETRVVVKYNVTDITYSTHIAGNCENFAEMEVDGVVQSNVNGSYQFDSIGEHTIKYTLIDNTSIVVSSFQGCNNITKVTIPNSVTNIGNYAFHYCTGLIEVIIPDSITSIGNYAFQRCSSLTSVTIGNSVTSIGQNVFSQCYSLTSITSHVISAPEVESNTFYDVSNGGTLYVPIGSSGYNAWMDTSNYYLGSYNWTKVEQ